MVVHFKPDSTLASRLLGAVSAPQMASHKAEAFLILTSPSGDSFVTRVPRATGALVSIVTLPGGAYFSLEWCEYLRKCSLAALVAAAGGGSGEYNEILIHSALDISPPEQFIRVNTH